MKKKKAISPIISTVLLIMIVIVLAIIILLWSRGFVKEAITKDIAGNEKRVNEFCLDVKISSIINDDVIRTFGFENTGNVPIYAYKVKLVGKDDGKSEVVKVTKEGGGSVNPGFSVFVDSDVIGEGKGYDDFELIKIIPILLGESKSGTKEFECPEKNGFVI